MGDGEHAHVCTMGNCGEKCDCVIPQKAKAWVNNVLKTVNPFEKLEKVRLLEESSEELLLAAIQKTANNQAPLGERRRKIDGLRGEDLPIFTPFIDHSLGIDLRNDLPTASATHDLSEAVVSVSTLQIYVVTWNMNGKLPSSNLAELVDNGLGRYDLYAIGLQEAPNSFIESFFADVLGEDYSLIATSMMLSLQLCLFVKKSLQKYFSDMKIDKVGVGGLGGVVGRQKGAVAVTFRFKEASFLFVACHLAPHQGNLEERNAQYSRICQSLFSRPSAGICSCLQNTAVVADEYEEQALCRSIVEDSDLVVWFGDLNYRVEGSRSSVGLMVKHNLEKFLWAKDQLSREFQHGHIFSGFQEGPLSFRPTYKYDVGTDNYDSSEKERVPSWTDRILIKVSQKSYVKADLQDYNSINSLKTSDHRPVKALVKVSNLE
ncbi:hypothetical protein O6H91_20G040100 [Diphasiastrum complanatum]|uniref:Uncharacterized protein n=1 Tax=Diphasiastrum complanatum TaxID=34168 RepID=A0ACC2API4_DIPCM|nr:hypothetical protein O6H91_Y477600 [Diphasiastrum complanatum]KAJ7519472.1 hypothetical protein O6H91_20G040100 [Diphasiastrum complanatum]